MSLKKFLEMLLSEEFEFPDLKNLSDLKQKGEVTEETETSGDTVTKRIHFKSNDGTTEIYRSVSTNKNFEKHNRISELTRKINKLLQEGNFEDAIPLRDEVRKLQDEVKKPKELTGKQ